MRILQLFWLLLPIAALSQKDDPGIFYQMLEGSFSLRRNDDRDETHVYQEEEDEPYWFLPDGLAVRGGIGLRHKNSLFLGLHAGADLKAFYKVVSAPVFANVKISPKLTKNDESRLFLMAGYGHAFAIGRGNLSGPFKRISLGIETLEIDPIGGVFIDLSHYDFPIGGQPHYSAISFGILATF